MEFSALMGLGAAIGTQFLESVCGNIEVFTNIWSFISYHNRIDENRQTLKRKLEALCCVEDDVKTTVEVAEFRTGKKRKREVENWLISVQNMKNDGLRMEREIGERKYLLGPWWEDRVAEKICEVNDLYEQGKFESPLLDVHETTGSCRLLATNLVGQHSNEGVLERIWACLMDDCVLRIGVYGVEGVGKSALTMHIHNQLLENANFENVWWVSLSQEFSIHRLQTEIAREVGLDFSDEEDTIKRAAKLCKGISKRKRCLLILDGLSTYVDQEKVGIPSGMNICNCKLIITTRSLRLCQRMSCQEDIEIKPLLGEQAETLFKQKLEMGVTAGDLEDISKLVVEECGGLPGKLISVAESMRGEDDVSQWREMLGTLRHLNYK